MNEASAISPMNQASSMPRSRPDVIVPSPPSSLMREKICSASASSRSVSASTYHDPPSGSTTLRTPVSSAITCWVRSAICAAFSDGRASTSSSALVCNEFVPPITAASASIAVRTMLFSGCWAVSETPAVWVWNRSHCARSVFAPYTSRIQRAQMRRAARSLAISSKKSMCASKKNDSPGANVSTSSPRDLPSST